MEDPISRVYNCYQEGPERPVSAACQAAVALSGPQHLYDWNGINQLPNGDHQAFVPDGQLCSGGKASHAGQDLARDDWPSQSIASDANGNFEFVYRATAPHSTRYFDFYVTKDGYDPTKPLAWSDLEASPFCTITSVTLEDGRYRMNCALPQGKEGKHLIYSVWQHDDSAEAFYACIDVEFGNGTPSPSSTPQPPTPTPATPTPPTATPTVIAPPTATPEPPGDLCRVDYVITTDWKSGFNANVTITNPGTAPISGWELTWTFPGNQMISTLWNGSHSQSGAAVSVTNASWTATIPANGGSVTVGFGASYSGANAQPSDFALNGVACTGGGPTDPGNSDPPQDRNRLFLPLLTQSR